jgi:hypothetical protein
MGKINRLAKNMPRQPAPPAPVLPPVLKAILDWELLRKPLRELDQPLEGFEG